MFQLINESHKAIFAYLRLKNSDDLAFYLKWSAIETHHALYTSGVINLMQHLAHIEPGEDVTWKERPREIDRVIAVLGMTTCLDSRGEGFYAPCR